MKKESSYSESIQVPSIAALVTTKTKIQSHEKYH